MTPTDPGPAPPTQDSTVPPPLRPLEVVHLEPPDGQGTLLRDPLGIAPDQHLLDARDWAIARRLDGIRSSAAIAQELARTELPGLGESEVDEVVRALSQRCLLRDEHFDRTAGEHLDHFRAAPRRAALGPGRDYEPDAFDLRMRIGGLVADDWDMPPLPHALGALGPGGRLGGAGPLYSRTYASLRHVPKPDRIVILGGLGAPMGPLLVPLDRDLETPLGPVPVDREALAALGRLPGREILAHRSALVLERQALFTRVLFRKTPVLPILVGALRQAPGETASSPNGIDEVEEALDSLDRVLELPGRSLVVCASDLFRVGPRHPGPCRIEGEDLGNLRRSDSRALDHAVELDAAGFWSNAETEGDPGRAAQVLAPYLFLRLFEAGRHPLPEGTTARRAHLLGYRQMQAPGECTSAASLVVAAAPETPS